MASNMMFGQKLTGFELFIAYLALPNLFDCIFWHLLSFPDKLFNFLLHQHHVFRSLSDLFDLLLDVLVDLFEDRLGVRQLLVVLFDS